MKKYLLQLTPLLIILLLTIGDVFGQGFNNFSRKKYLTLGGGAGVGYYHGDLTPLPGVVSFDIGLPRPAVAVEASHKFAPRWSARLGFYWTQIFGDDFQSADPRKPESIGRYYRNLHAKNNIFEFSPQIVFDFVRNLNYYNARPLFTPYIFAGISVFYHNPQAKTPASRYVLVPRAEALPTVESVEIGTPEWVDLKPLQTGGVDYSRFQVAVPFGVGVRVAVSDRANIGLEFKYDRTFTDYLDDVSNTPYPDKAGRSELEKAMSVRAGESTAAYNGKSRDLINILSANGQGLTEYTYSDNTSYVSVGGFSHLPNSEIRGNEELDHFFTTMLKFEWIFGQTSSLPKLR